MKIKKETVVDIILTLAIVMLSFLAGYITKVNKLEERILQEQEKQKICWDELYETRETYENIK